ncbi:hypothetical protein CWC11_04100 [Pseudoalteromonas sp. S3178]|uniref:DUF4402 domain-containing protein n=1 Tax=Pseudoalteromonas sp. S3178 TaxID=579532 RepID=UPI00110A1B1D|nr:DUF4402 domain-containing protein [Pseudoalteromonas sp. S3178]TMP09372.1 hypothetical protein CWC11_04100 [Pseudoalteromonas sp. S3178]
MKFYLSTLAVVTAVSSFSSFAATESFEAKVTVQNAVVLTKDNDLSFGTIRAIADPTGGEQATLVVNPDPDASPVSTQSNPVSNAATISVIEDGEAAGFSVSDVVPNSILTITDPVNTLIVSSAGQGVNEPDFTVDSWTYFITSGTNAGALYTQATPNLQAGADGAVSFNIGAKLSTSSSVSSVDYPDGEYSGSFNIEVSY